jgi:hypothetical protein
MTAFFVFAAPAKLRLIIAHRFKLSANRRNRNGCRPFPRITNATFGLGPILINQVFGLNKVIAVRTLFHARISRRFRRRAACFR